MDTDYSSDETAIISALTGEPRCPTDRVTKEGNRGCGSLKIYVGCIYNVCLNCGLSFYVDLDKKVWFASPHALNEWRKDYERVHG